MKTRDSRIIDLSNKRFNRYLVIGGPERRGQGNIVCWLVRCDCGTERWIDGQHLRYGKAGSCGCLSRELTSKRKLRHGMTDTREYNTWCKMLARCYVPTTEHYRFYGGRGIKVCQRWRDCFDNFFADMGPKPTPGHSIERDDVNGDYEPDNCRWITRGEQNRNTTRNVWIEHAGRRMLLADWAREYGMKAHSIRSRIARGWDFERAITTPMRGSPTAPAEVEREAAAFKDDTASQFDHGRDNREGEPRTAAE